MGSCCFFLSFTPTPFLLPVNTKAPPDARPASDPHCSFLLSISWHQSLHYCGVQDFEQIETLFEPEHQIHIVSSIHGTDLWRMTKVTSEELMFHKTLGPISLTQ